MIIKQQAIIDALKTGPKTWRMLAYAMGYDINRLHTEDRGWWWNLWNRDYVEELNDNGHSLRQMLKDMCRLKIIVCIGNAENGPWKLPDEAK